MTGISSSNKRSVSLLNVEKVLKPPQNPITTMYNKSSDHCNLRASITVNMPTKIEAKLLQIKVPQGNTNNGLMYRFMMKRKTLPNPPPKKTYKYSFIRLKIRADKLFYF